MPVKVKVNVTALNRLRQRPEALLRALEEPLRDIAKKALDVSQTLVPRRSTDERAQYADGDAPPQPPLADTGFVSGPEFNLSRMSVTMTAGYEHPAAGAIHEGFHWGAEIINPPPHFMRKGFRKSRGRARKGVSRVLTAYLAKHFPSR
ncbi:hypothetical protein VZQ01_06830 [Myxococcus faecalis]|uniref:hypothetical protein n=1 Tax=Myxococcus faecalis TaxID=3115646 RepID=UPI003CEFF429